MDGKSRPGTRQSGQPDTLRESGAQSFRASLTREILVTDEGWITNNRIVNGLRLPLEEIANANICTESLDREPFASLAYGCGMNIHSINLVGDALAIASKGQELVRRRQKEGGIPAARLQHAIR